jgi:hypothetical protein
VMLPNISWRSPCDFSRRGEIFIPRYPV